MRCIMVLWAMVFLSCSSQNAFVDKSYRGKKIVNATLVIAPFTRTPTVNNAHVVKEDLDLDVFEENYGKFFAQNFPRHIREQSSFAKVLQGDYEKFPRFKKYVFPLKKGKKLRMNLPRKGEVVAFKSVEGDYILFLQDVVMSFWREIYSSSDLTQTFAVEGFDSKDPRILRMKKYQYFIIQTASFAFWDNRVGKIVVYGRATVKTKIEDTDIDAINDVLNRSLKGMAENILKSSPFEKT